MNDELTKLMKQKNDTETQIIDELAKLKNWSSECNCKDVRKFGNFNLVVHYGIEDRNETEEIQSFCLECGGNIK